MSRPNEIHTRLVLDIEDVSLQVERVLQGFIAEPTPGLYVYNSSQPLLDFTKVYYSVDTVYKRDTNKVIHTPRRLNFDEIINPTGKVFDQDMQLVIDFSRNKIPLSNGPTSPFIAFRILQLFASTVVYNKVEWGSFPKMNTEDFLEQLEYQDLVNLDGKELTDKVYFDIIDKLECILMDVRTNINDFMGKDVYNCYDIELKDNLLYITKMSDYRIHEHENNIRVEKWKMELDASM